MCQYCNQKQNLYNLAWRPEQIAEHNSRSLLSFAECTVHAMPGGTFRLSDRGNYLDRSETERVITGLREYMSIFDDEDLELINQECVDPVVRYVSSKSGRKVETGYVYFLASEGGKYKIGRTKNYKSRAKTFGVKLPFDVHYELVLSSDDYAQFELDIHSRFADKWIRGEWFALTAEDIEAIRAEYADQVVVIEDGVDNG